MSVISRQIKIRTHHVVRKHTDRLTNGRQAVRADKQLDERSDVQTGRFEQTRYPQVACLRMGKQKRVLSNMIYLQKK